MDQLQPLFSRNEDYQKIAFMNWRMTQGAELASMLNMADGFMMSSTEIANRCIDDNRNKEADILIFPAFANAIHGIELYLKGINWALNDLNGSRQKIEGKHNIKQIFQTIQGKIKLKGPGELKAFNVQMRGLSTLIDEIYQRAGSTAKDDKMDFARYPFSRDEGDHFYADEWTNVEVDLENFVHRISSIHSTLKEFSDHYLQLYYSSRESVD